MTNLSSRAMGMAVVIALVCILGMSAVAQQKPAAPKTQWAAPDVLPLTCAQAWDKAGKTYPKMLSIVVTLARVSLANRDLSFPDTREAGLEAGKGIANDCKADPNGLLFAIVDKHVRQIAESATRASQRWSAKEDFTVHGFEQKVYSVAPAGLVPLNYCSPQLTPWATL